MGGPRDQFSLLEAPDSLAKRAAAHPIATCDFGLADLRAREEFSFDDGFAEQSKHPVGLGFRLELACFLLRFRFLRFHPIFIPVHSVDKNTFYTSYIIIKWSFMPIV